MADLGSIGDKVGGVYAVPALGFSGAVLDDAGAAARRVVRLYNRSTGALIGETQSRADTGAYAIATTMPNEAAPHQLVFLDDDAGTQHDDIIRGRVSPT